MRNLSRILAALLLGALSIFAAGLPASAADPSCTSTDDGYTAGGVCAAHVTKAEAVCLNNVLSMTYVVEVGASGPTTVDLHWVNPAGPAFVQAGQPLTATVAWPASISRVPVDVQFVAGTATATVRVDPTAASETCTTSRVLAAHDTTPTVTSRVLAATGAEILPWLVAAGGLLIVGTGLLVTRVVRGRRLNSEQ